MQVRIPRPAGRGVMVNDCTSQRIGPLVKGFFSHAMDNTAFGGIIEQF